MSKTLELTDEQYSIINEAAKAAGLTPQELFLQWAMDEESHHRRAHPTYFETDDWLRHLGVSDERIQRANAGSATEEDEADANA